MFRFNSLLHLNRHNIAIIGNGGFAREIACNLKKDSYKFYINKNVIKYIYIKPRFKKIKNNYYLTIGLITNRRIYKYKKYNIQYDFYYFNNELTLTYISPTNPYNSMLAMDFNNGCLVVLNNHDLYNILSYTSDVVELYYNSYAFTSDWFPFSIKIID